MQLQNYLSIYKIGGVCDEKGFSCRFSNHFGFSFLGCNLFSSGPGVTITKSPKNLLFITQSDQRSAFRPILSTEPVVDMKFFTPAELGADSYTLQFSADSGTTWANYQYASSDLVTDFAETSDNFSLNLPAHYQLRLLITGGTYDGQTLNEVDVPLSSKPTYFFYLDLFAGIDNTGVMPPKAGHGLVASFTVKNVSDNSVVPNALTYQWYRINPNDYEDITLIPGAESLSYTTTSADIGYLLLIRAKGDEISADGFCQMLSFEPVK